MKELIDEMSYDLAECHMDYLDDAKLYTDYDAMAQKMVSRGYRKQIEGEWIHQEDEFGLEFYRCSICGGEVIGTPKFCGDCGAKMKGGAE